MSKVTIVFKVRETIYILGLGAPRPRERPDGGETLPLKVLSPSQRISPIFNFSQEISPASSIISIFGFGHDGAGKWTFAGRRQVPNDQLSNEFLELVSFSR